MQLGFFAAGRFARRLAPIGLEPRQFGLLRAIAAAGGQSQQALAAAVGIHPSKIVALVDDLEQAGFVDRTRSSDDRRTNAVSLTPAGRDALARAKAISEAHADDVLSPLDAAERAELTRLLNRLADAHDLGRFTMPRPAR